jgi:peptidoglycan/xylan/chitin deacetylase (PgdA/CDA1 family)
LASVRRAIKRWIPRRWLGRPFAWTVSQLGRLSGRRAGIAIVYHRVGDPQGDPERELVPALGTDLFEAQVRHLRTRYRVVAAAELLHAARTRRRGERFPVAITFDDDIPSHSRAARATLTKIGVPATFFLCGASLERPFAFWWERLQAAVDHGLLPNVGPENIHAVALGIQRMGPQERDAEAARLGSLVGPDPADAGLRSDDVRALADAGFGIGFHTLRHYWLPGLDDDALDHAMEQGRAELESASGRRLTMIAYPHGGGNERATAAARAAGYEAGFLTGDAAVTPATDPMLVGRIEPSFRSLGHFAFEVAFALLRGRWQAA